MNQLFDNFLMAIKYSDIEKVQVLLNEPFIQENINTKTAQDFTPLMRAVLEANPEVIRLLLEHGANPNDTIGGMNSLMLGINSRGRITSETIDDLVKYHVAFSNPDYNQYSLIQASHLGYNNIVSKLLEVGADVDQEDSYGNNALFSAITQARDDVIDTLLKAGINIEKTNTHKEDVMSIAVNYYLEIVPKLIAYGYPMEKINYQEMSEKDKEEVKKLIQPFIEKKQLDETLLDNTNDQHKNTPIESNKKLKL
jgi:ankyrin repeat protein